MAHGGRPKDRLPEKTARMAAKRDYYEVLGVPRNAGQDEIKRAYRRLARQNHPDMSKAADAEERFKEINEAYQVLSDQQKRGQYDRFGTVDVQDLGGFGFGGLDDIFESFFGGFGTRRPDRRGPLRGSDLRYDMTLDFGEAVFGCEKDVEIPRLETCPNCVGTGAEPGTQPIRCPECNGQGQVRRVRQSMLGSFVNVSTCPRCQGTGETVNTPCSTCHGAQRVEQFKGIMVDIPAGVDDGMRVRLAGEGEAGLHGGPAGNLYVVLHVKPHRYFRRREHDILLDININIAQAALGDEIRVPTLDGDEKLVIPAGTQAGTVLRLRGKGVPRLRASGRGDQIIVVGISVPTRLDESQRHLLTELGKTLGHEVTPQAEKGFLERLREALGI